MKRILALSILALLILPRITFAAWAATESFESYSNGASLNGGSGGTGWTSNWGNPVGTVTTDTAPAGGKCSTAGLAWHTTQTGDSRLDRSFTATNTGTVRFWFYQSSANAGTTQYIVWRIGTTGMMGIEINATSGGISASDNATYTTDTGLDFTPNAWNYIDFKFGHSAGMFAVSINGSAYSADFVAKASDTTTDNFTIIDVFNSSHDFYFDDLGDPACPAPAAAQTSIVEMGDGIVDVGDGIIDIKS